MGDPNIITKPSHWSELLRSDQSEPYFFEFCLLIPDAADDISSSEVAMEGVFNYHK